jgi:dienelactone hydrolase
MPDMFDGDQAPNASTTVEEMNLTVIEQVKLRAAAVAKSFFLDMWLARHTAAKIMPILYKVLEGAQEEFADAVAHGNGVYGVGYCLGAKYCLLLAGEGHDPYSKGQRAQDEEALPVAHGPYLKAGAIAHGTLVTMEDFEKLKSPMLLICVEDDQLFPQEVLEQAQEHMEEHNVSHQVKVIPGVPHGQSIELSFDPH